MTDLHDVITAARPEPTYIEVWRTRQKRLFIAIMAAGLLLLVVGVGWITRPQDNAGLAVTMVLLGFAAILVSGWFGLRALVGEPPES